MATTEIRRRVEATDEQVDELLAIPEINEAFQAYIRLTHEYRDAVLTAIRFHAEDGLPDISPIKRDYMSRLERQRLFVRQLVDDHS